MQDLDVAIIKSTTPQFHVIPKEKHVRSECSSGLMLFLRNTNSVSMISHWDSNVMRAT